MKTVIIGNKEITTFENGRKRVRTINSLPSKTQQQFKEQCDVNYIMKKYKLTGEVTHLNRRTPLNNGSEELDLTSIPSYQDSLHIVIQAQNAFQNLNSDIRKRFGNDPHEYIQFLQDPKNDDEAVKLGLKIKKQPPVEDPTLTTLKEIATNTKNAKTKNAKNVNSDSNFDE